MSVLSRTNPRRLDTRITFQHKVETRDDSGELIVTWQDFASCFACVDAVKANERFKADQELSGNEYTIWIVWRGDLDTNMRIVWNGRLFNITGIPDNQRRGEWMSIFAEEGINEG